MMHICVGPNYERMALFQELDEEIHFVYTLASKKMDGKELLFLEFDNSKYIEIISKEDLSFACRLVVSSYGTTALKKKPLPKTLTEIEKEPTWNLAVFSNLLPVDNFSPVCEITES